MLCSDRINILFLLCGICGGRSGTGPGLSQSTSVFPLSVSFHQCPMHIKSPVTDAVKSLQLTASLNNSHRPALSVYCSHCRSTTVALSVYSSSLHQLSYFLTLFSDIIILIWFFHFHLILNVNFPIIFISLHFNNFLWATFSPFIT
jgi:hypothetical protein